MVDLGFREGQVSSANQCNWPGVSCFGNGDLKGLELSDFGLSGTLATEIGLLGNLEFIDLSYNKIEGTIPTEIGELDQRLTYFDVYDNELTGTIPTEIGDLDDLEELYLGKNDLTGTIPTELGRLDELKKLYLDDNELTGTVPLELANMDKLKELDISKNNLIGSVTHVCSTVDWVNYDTNELIGFGPGCEVQEPSPFFGLLTLFNLFVWILSLLGIENISIQIGGSGD